MFKDKKALLLWAVLAVAIMCLPFACTQLKECSRSGSASIKAQSVSVKLSCLF